MSDKTQPTPPPTPVQKTASVPLKKETVRITLRARPGAGMTQPKEMTAPVPPPSITSPVPRPITTSVTPAGASGNTGRVPTAPAPMSPVPLAKTGSISLASKATAPIQLPSAPLPPPAARPATAPVQLPPGAPAAARTTTYVKLDAVPAPAAPPRPLAPGAPPAPGLAPTVPLAKAPAPPRPGAPAAPRPPGAAPVPPRPGAPAAPGGAAPLAPTVPLAKAPAPGRPLGAKVEAGASTVPLSKAPGVVAPKPAGGSGTAPIAKTGGPTQNLPKATVQLSKSPAPATQPLNKGGVASPAAPAVPARRPSTGEDSAALDDDRDPEAGLAPLAVVCTVLAIGLMALNLFGSDKHFVADQGVESPFLVPDRPRASWEKLNADGTYTSNFKTELKNITNNFD